MITKKCFRESVHRDLTYAQQAPPANLSMNHELSSNAGQMEQARVVKWRLVRATDSIQREGQQT